MINWHDIQFFVGGFLFGFAICYIYTEWAFENRRKDKDK